MVKKSDGRVKMQGFHVLSNKDKHNIDKNLTMIGTAGSVECQAVLRADM